MIPIFLAIPTYFEPQNFLGNFFCTATGYVLILTKNGLGYIFGYICSLLWSPCLRLNSYFLRTGLRGQCLKNIELSKFELSWVV
jgi:hypothetical protein